MLQLTRPFCDQIALGLPWLDPNQRRRSCCQRAQMSMLTQPPATNKRNKACPSIAPPHAMLLARFDGGIGHGQHRLEHWHHHALLSGCNPKNGLRTRTVSAAGSRSCSSLCECDRTLAWKECVMNTPEVQEVLYASDGPQHPGVGLSGVGIHLFW